MTGSIYLETIETECPVAIDVSFVEKAPPAKLSFEEKKDFWSAKHKAYGYKILCAVDRGGRCVFASNLFPGSVHDLEIARDEKTLPSLKKLIELHGGKLLADKGFIGLDASVATVTPTRQNQDEIEGLNLEIASQRVIIENFFGRMKHLFLILDHLYRTPVEYLEQMIIVLIWLTNEHVKIKPLRRHSIEPAISSQE